MIVRVEIQGGRARVRSEDDSYRATIVVSAPLLARMGGRREAYFDMKTQPGGGKKDWEDGKGVQFYRDPVEVVELGERVPDQCWERSPKSVPPPPPSPSPPSTRARCACGCQPPPDQRKKGVIYDADSGVRMSYATDKILSERRSGETWTVFDGGVKRRLVLG